MSEKEFTREELMNIYESVTSEILEELSENSTYTLTNESFELKAKREILSILKSENIVDEIEKITDKTIAQLKKLKREFLFNKLREPKLDKNGNA